MWQSLLMSVLIFGGKDPWPSKLGTAISHQHIPHGLCELCVLLALSDCLAWHDISISTYFLESFTPFMTPPSLMAIQAFQLYQDFLQVSKTHLSSKFPLYLGIFSKVLNPMFQKSVPKSITLASPVVCFAYWSNILKIQSHRCSYDYWNYMTASSWGFMGWFFSHF